MSLDLTHLHWALNPSGRSSSCGSYLKAVQDGRYYKLSAGSAGMGIYGHESINECLISDILDLLSIPHLKYCGELADITLSGKTYTTFVCGSDDFCAESESKITLEAFYELKKVHNEDVIDFCKRYKFWEDIKFMLVSDFLFINRDRHGANIELLKSSDGSVRVAPLFDNGLSLVGPYANSIELIKTFDVLLDRETNNFIGSSSLLENLRLLDTPIKVAEPSTVQVLDVLFKYEKILSPIHLQKINEIICKRYTFLEKEGFICH